MLRAVEEQRALKYTRDGMSDEPNPKSYVGGLELPGLGLAPSGRLPVEPAWLVTDAHAEIVVRPVPQRRGGVRFSIGPQTNPESVILSPGGECGDTCIIAGQVGSATDNEISRELLKLFSTEIQRQFKRIQSYYVGSEAERRLDQGHRLTSDVQMPPTHDLRRP